MSQRFVQANVTLRARRHRRVRARVHGTAARPRLSMFRSGQHVTAQLVDDAAGVTIVSATDRELSLPHTSSSRGKGEKEGVEQRKVASAHAVGKLLAERAKEKGIIAAVFDRGGYAYHGRVRAVAEGAREGGLEF